MLLILAATIASAAALSITAPKALVLSSDGSQLRSESLVNPPSTPITLHSTDTLKLTFTVQEKDQGVRPHQTFLRFYDADSGEEGIQPVRVSASGKAKFDLNMARPPLSLPPTTDKPIHVSLILGSFTHPPAKIYLFDLVLPESQPPPQHPDEASFHVLPEIQHTFRPEQKVPPKAISAFFAGLVVSPWLVLITLYSSVPQKLTHIGSPNILGFITLLAAFETLLLWYWVDLRLGQVLLYGALLGSLTVAAGNRALSSVAKWRVGK
ncbi:oligosaccharyl transferase delta subunit [Rickenella mellea]|uniref:Oligosaccharyl transferase delta subunit n=1 Tax=Rickenella mellea TaxID=50990 RepID=A0A4Y7Q5D2_9AGAM|nr:oligosaccharyl transferase delta subunit [Rickenella mellea]